MNNNVLYTFDDLELEKKVIGPMNQGVNLINLELEVDLTHVPNYLMYKKDNPNLNKVLALINLLKKLHEKGLSWSNRDIIHFINEIKELNDNNELEDKIQKLFYFSTHKELVLTTFEGKRIYAKSINQKTYIDNLKNNSINFVIGPAGSGKTYLAVAYAVSELKKGNINKIIITRPVVEAGEKLGFLPGDLKEKVDPYLIPIYDALSEFLGKDIMERDMDRGIIEIAPLAYMRGRTLDNAVIILDEAQNTTTNQMKMFITRLGFNSKMIITGDISQIDLNRDVKSGLIEATSILNDINGIKINRFNKIDVMRHPLVSKIIERYEKLDNGSL